MAARLATYLVVAIVAGTLIAGLIVGAQRADDSGPVEIIIHNAKVYAPTISARIADAVAIRGNKILKVGSEREIMRYRRPQTAVIDAKGAAVLPGFDDAHGRSLRVSRARRRAARRRGHARRDPGPRRELGGCEAGRRMDHGRRLVVRRVRRFADPLAARRRRQRSSGSTPFTGWTSAVAQHQALEAARITKRTPTPKTGAIVRDRRGEPTGLLKGSAMALADHALPKPTREERAKALQVAMHDAQQRGVTSGTTSARARRSGPVRRGARRGNARPARLRGGARGTHDAGGPRRDREALSR